MKERYIRAFGKGGIEPVGSLSGLAGAAAGFTGGDPAPDVAGPSLPDAPGTVLSAVGAFGPSVADAPSPVFPPGETAEASG